MGDRITAEQVLAWGPCYAKSRVRELVGDGLTPREILDLDIPPADRLWVFLRLMSPSDHRLFAAACAERALMRSGVTDQRSWGAVRVARLHALGEASDQELADAARSARAAALAALAAQYAARYAAQATACEAAQAAAQYAAWDAAQDAALAAAWDNAWDAQLDNALRLVEAK